MNFCTSCGSKLEKGVKFCADCGSAVDTEVAGSTQQSQLPVRHGKARGSDAGDDYKLTELDELCTDAMAQLDQLISNDNIEYMVFWSKADDYLFTVKYELEVVDTVIPEWLAEDLTVFAPIDDDDENETDKHVYLLPEDFFEFDDTETGFALLAELFELSDCGAPGDVRCEIVHRSNRGTKGTYIMPQA